MAALVMAGVPCRAWVRPCGFKTLLLILIGMFPIGEASNPGPDHFEDHFTLGTFNPSGLRNKAQFFQTHLAFGDVWTVAETHFLERMSHDSRLGW